MKKMICRDLGGTCDKELVAESWNDMVVVMTNHVIESHPDVAKQMERMHAEDPQRWGREMKPKWESAPEV